MRSVFGWCYPAGAENDPNAPYNQIDFREKYEDDVLARIDEQIKDFDCDFIEFIYDETYKKEEAPDELDDFIDWYRNHPQEWKDDIQQKYSDKVFDDVLEVVVEEASEEPDYDRDDY